ncbi:MAG: hypothetical protein OHK0039_14410 [Bacteroidia bacterium]
MRHLLFALLALGLLLPACQMSRELRAPRQELKRLAYVEMDPQAKFDGMARTLLDAMQAATAAGSPLKTQRYLRKFTQQNKDELQVLAAQLRTWIDGMGPLQKVGFAAQTLTKPYIRDLVQALPHILQTLRENKGELGPLEQAILVYRLKQLVD